MQSENRASKNRPVGKATAATLDGDARSQTLAASPRCLNALKDLARLLGRAAAEEFLQVQSKELEQQATIESLPTGTGDERHG